VVRLPRSWLEGLGPIDALWKSRRNEDLVPRSLCGLFQSPKGQSSKNQAMSRRCVQSICSLARAVIARIGNYSFAAAWSARKIKTGSFSANGCECSTPALCQTDQAIFPSTDKSELIQEILTVLAVTGAATTLFLKERTISAPTVTDDLAVWPNADGRFSILEIMFDVLQC
jgi:hypothetical protein